MMTFQSNRSHVLLTLGTLFAFGGASRFLPNGTASAEEKIPPVSTELLQDVEHAPENHALPATDAAEFQATASEEVCLTEEAAEKFSEDLWLFETEREELRQKHIKLQSWEATLDAQTTELRALQTALAARWEEMQQQANQDIIHLAKIYGAMKAEQAAEIFNQMDPDFAAGFLKQLPSDQAGTILANMEKKKAYIVSVSMASDNADIRID